MNVRPGLGAFFVFAVALAGCLFCGFVAPQLFSKGTVVLRPWMFNGILFFGLIALLSVLFGWRGLYNWIQSTPRK